MSRAARRDHVAFTLFEVALCLALVALAVISVVTLLPVGLKAQQVARYQVIASAKAIELIDQFVNAANYTFNMEQEAPHPWDAASSYSNLAPDLEHRATAVGTSVYPLPLTIARRLDSPDDQIRRVLDAGGNLYYSQALTATVLRESAIDIITPGAASEAQRLIFAVVGPAQQNAMHVFP